MAGAVKVFRFQICASPLHELVEQCLHPVQCRPSGGRDLEHLGPSMRRIRTVQSKLIIDQEVGNALDALPGVSELFGDARDRC